jgi:hypothetical protein
MIRAYKSALKRIPWTKSPTALSNEKDVLLLENNEIKKRQIQLERNIEQLTKNVLELGKLEGRYAELVTETSARTTLLTETITKREGDIIPARKSAQRRAQLVFLGGETAVHEWQEKVLETKNR